MDFLKKNYEKILLGMVLAGLAAVVVFLFIWISQEKSKLGERTQTIIRRSAKPAEPLKLEYYDDLLRKVTSPVPLDLSMTNRLFNPVKWQKAPDGRLIKLLRGDETGPRALVITNIAPLYVTISLDQVTTNESFTRYTITVEREAASTAYQRRRRYSISYPFMGGNNKNDVFVLEEVRGLPEDPDLVLTLVETGETVHLSKTKSISRPEAYRADLKYDPENRAFKNCRVGSLISFGGEAYNVVAISENEVVISANSNNKKTTITYSGPP